MTSSGRVGSLVLKVAELCNLACSYCYMYQHADQTYRNRPKFMSDDVYRRTLERVGEYCTSLPGHQMELCFHGGEPTLLGIDRMERLAILARETLGPHLSGLVIQTNATLVDAEWAAMFARQQIKVGVSMDGPPEIHDSVRVDHAGRGTLAKTLEGIAHLQREGAFSSVLCVINPRSSGLDTYRFFRSMGVHSIDYLMPDVSHDQKELWYGDCGSEPVADYLIPIFREWFLNDHADTRIRIFWSLLRLMFGAPGLTDNFGNPTMGYLVIESDGTIHALDALRVCEEGIEDSGLNVFDHGFDDLETGLPLVHQMVTEGLPLCATCQNCEERDVCGGGYTPHRYSRARGFDNPSVWCADILHLIREMRTHVAVALDA